MIDQALIDRATKLINNGTMYKDVAEALGVKPCTVSSWRMRGLIPPAPFKPTAKQAPIENQKKGPATTARSGTRSPCPSWSPGSGWTGRPL